MNIVFMGTPMFAVTCLEQIIKDKHCVSGIFTQTDKPRGRGNVVSPSPVKLAALANGITVYQPNSLRDSATVDLITGISPDLIIVVAYGKILPKEILEIPRKGCVNIHASLLPKYRGAAPIQWAVINGEKETGITSILMNEGMDTGDILLSENTFINNEENSGQLFDRLALIGARVLSKTINGIENDSIFPVKQDNSLSSFAPMIQKSMGRINWSESSDRIHNLIRGLAPYLYATTTSNGKNLRVLSSSLSNYKKGEPGEVVESGERLVVSCGNRTAIELKIVQAEGKRALPANEFLKGNKIAKHQFFV